MAIGSNWFRFFRREVLPRGRSVFLHRNVRLATSLAIVVATGIRFIPRAAPFPAITFSDFCTATLVFSGLSYGGAMTCSVLAIGLPADRVFLATMAVNSTQRGAVLYRPVSDGLVRQSDRGLGVIRGFTEGFSVALR